MQGSANIRWEDKATQTDPWLIGDFLEAYSLGKIARLSTSARGMSDSQVLAKAFRGPANARSEVGVVLMTCEQRLRLYNSKIDDFFDVFFASGVSSKFASPKFWSLTSKLHKVSYPPEDLTTKACPFGPLSSLLLYLSQSKILNHLSMLSDLRDIEQALRQIEPSWFSLGLFLTLCDRVAHPDAFSALLQKLEAVVRPFVDLLEVEISFSQLHFELKSKRGLPFEELALSVDHPQAASITPQRPKNPPPPCIDALLKEIMKISRDFCHVLCSNPYLG